MQLHRRLNRTIRILAQIIRGVVANDPVSCAAKKTLSMDGLEFLARMGQAQLSHAQFAEPKCTLANHDFRQTA